MAAGAKNLSRTFVWIIVALLIVALAGFGATNLSGTIRTIGHVGNQPISVDSFARELQREMQVIQSQTGQPMQLEQARAFGLDQLVLSRLVQLAALDHENSELGLSLGDENLQQDIVQMPAFRGIDGNFDRESYRFALQQAGVNERDFEEELRAESARAMIQAALMSGVEMPDVLAQSLSDYVGARRSFTWALLDESALEIAFSAPTDADLKAYYDENTDQFMLPEARRLTYAVLTPEMVIDTVEVDDEAVRTLFEDRSAEYELPERRLVERLVFADEETASSAMAQLDVGGTTFEVLVEERGFNLSDVDLGDATQQSLGDAGEAIFAAEVGTVVGPLPSSLGPALFRVNAVLPAQSTDFDEVKDELRDELAGEQARRYIDSVTESYEDILARGATLEDLVRETDMDLGVIDWTGQDAEGIAAYNAFNRYAAQVRDSDFPEIRFLDDSGIFALRLDEVLPVRPNPFEDARDEVAETWHLNQVQTALTEIANRKIAELSTSGDFHAVGLSSKVENGLTRTAYIEETPADFMVQVFEMEKGELRVVPSENGVIMVRLDDILEPEASDELAQARDAVSEQMSQSLAQALFTAFAQDAQLRARPRIDQQALNAVLASFATGPGGGHY